MKVSKEIDTNMSSFHGSTVTASTADMVRILGGDYQNTGKTTHDWNCMTDDGVVFTVYDWKLGPQPENKKITWNIGGFSFNDTEKAKRELEKLI